MGKKRLEKMRKKKKQLRTVRSAESDKVTNKVSETHFISCGKIKKVKQNK